ncbi:MAG TPA: DMT family transporter [Candidatus Atribacteria bacterium]|nr:DMT family transporter [Candidatus Atribacteria bacterium]
MEKQEKEGIICVIITIFIAGALPIIIKYGTGIINPLFFATFSSLIAGIFLLKIAIIKGNWGILIDKRYFFYFLLIGFFGITLSNICFFFGVTLTSGINSSILLQIEPLYAILIGYLLLNEKITPKQIFFTAIIMLGTLVVVYRAKFIFNWGDLLVLLTPLCWQIAHFFSKRLMTNHKEVNPMLIATARTLYGGVFLLILSSAKGINQYDKLGVRSVLLILLFQGIIGFALHYSIWYEAIKRLNLSKATTLVSVYPTFSIALARLILKEIPNFYQIAGFGIIIMGVFGLSRIKSEHRENNILKY